MGKKKIRFFMVFLMAVMLFLTACAGQAEAPGDSKGSEESGGSGSNDSESSSNGSENGSTGSGSGTGDAEKASGAVSLKIWTEEYNVDMLNKMVESFKEHYKNEAEFDIVLEIMPDAETRNYVLRDVINAADIFHVPDDQMASLVGGGAVAPVADQEKIGAANLKEACDSVTFNGVMYAYPMTADNGYFMYYNKKYFKKKDLKTLDRMLKVAEAAGKKITMPFDSGWYCYSFFGNTGLDFGINEDGVTNHCNWNTTEGDITGLDVARAMQDFVNHPGFKYMTNDEFPQAAKDGEVIAGISGVWHAMDIKEAWGDDYGAVKLPTYTCKGQQIQMSSFTGYKGIGVNYYSKNKAWALKLADWITNEENQALRFAERNQGPSNINAAASDEVKKVPAIQAVIEQSQYGNLQRVGNNYWDPFTPFCAGLLEGGHSDEELQQLLDDLVEGITASSAK